MTEQAPRDGEMRIIPIELGEFYLEEYIDHKPEDCLGPPGWFQMIEWYCEWVGVPEAYGYFKSIEDAKTIADRYRKAKAEKLREQNEERIASERFRAENPPIYC